MFNADKVLMEKWAPVLDHDSAPIIESQEKKAITARLLENTEIALQEEAAQASFGGLSEAIAGTGSVNAAGPDPVLISLVRRAMPNLVAYDICGVQPMTGPTGLIFAMKARTGVARGNNSGAISASSAEALYNEADSSFSGTGTQVGSPEADVLGTVITLNDQAVLVSGDTYLFLGAGADGDAQAIIDVNLVSSSTDFHATTNPLVAGKSTFVADDDGTGLGAAGTVTVVGVFDSATTTGAGLLTATMEEENQFADMGFSIEKVTATAKTRALKAEYTMEMAQDLKAVHGLDAESELANILSAEVLAEINREVIRTVNSVAVPGGAGALRGVIDIKADAAGNVDNLGGRWGGEKFKALGFRLEQEANNIAVDTRRGKGNFMICSSTVASALSSAGVLDYSPGLDQRSLSVDSAGNTFAGTLGNGMKVYVDPYATIQYATVGYKGSSQYDAGLFYCPYVPLTMVKAVGEQTFQPKIGFKTRYAMQSNPLINATAGNGANRQNYYYRINRILNL